MIPAAKHTTAEAQRSLTPEDEAKIAQLLRESRDKQRSYADFFGWAAHRGLDVVAALRESLATVGSSFFSKPVSRCRPNEPPDCEATNYEDERLAAIEVTELVNE